MKISEVPFALLRFNYQLARFPLQVIEERVVTRIGTEAPARLFYERSLGMLDATVGNALGDPELVERGTALVERTDALSRAAKLDAKAETTREQANSKLERTRDQAVADRQEAEAATEQEIKEARAAAEQRKRDAARSAQKRSASAKQQADKVAAERKDAVKTTKRQVESTTRSVEKAAAKAAEARLDDAEEKLGEAAAKRAEAERVAELATAEKQKRQAERSSGSS
ncbi:IF2 family translation initiation factor [Mycobacterium sp. 852002-51057_SCH5723018]|uniref:IF2 family translation initiation factor n=1 Tax=Mycobacterium sp. 852002-51057_SCH5723018 TaxID=1834094 RepID=UPI000801AD2D|nr:IF2 family translation initiation factor [Mycobacterium sp. 852002-51057_SCH5723018]OBG18662.1 IF2 family translation initiation factor [Mycobacterium sp. 852002-51057_SCH5723018]